MRVVEVIPGKSVMGLEIPNEKREIVTLGEIIKSKSYDEVASPLALALGKDIGGAPVCADLAKMPHLLIAGTTGSGKSVAINAMVLSLLYKSTAEHVRLIMIDPKMLELSVYEGIPHLLAPVVTDMKHAANALRWCVAEMERRYQLMSALGVRNISGFNRKVKDAIDAGKPIRDPVMTAAAANDPTIDQKLIQDLDAAAVHRRHHRRARRHDDDRRQEGRRADCQTGAKGARQRHPPGAGHAASVGGRHHRPHQGQHSRAASPSRSRRASIRAPSSTRWAPSPCSGHGDMLYLPSGTSVPTRVHGAFVGDAEVHRVVDALKKSGAPNYIEDVLEGPRGPLAGISGEEPATGEGGDAGGEQDALYDEAVKIVTSERKPSISYVQRRLKIGYNRAARLLESMEAAGVVGPLQPNGSREILAAAPPADEAMADATRPAARVEAA